MIIDLYLGADFVGFASIATIYTLAIPAVFMSNLSKKILVAESKSRVLLSRSIIGIVGNCILSIVFYQWFGAIGCAIASVISFWFIGYFSSALNQESRHIFVMQSLSFNPLRLVK
jgi:Na+-driven multidrug efflux pump